MNLLLPWEERIDVGPKLGSLGSYWVRKRLRSNSGRIACFVSFTKRKEYRATWDELSQQSSSHGYTPTLEEAKIMCDAGLIKNGWKLINNPKYFLFI